MHISSVLSKPSRDAISSQESSGHRSGKRPYLCYFLSIFVPAAGITDHPSELWMVNRAKYMEQFFEDDTKKILIRDGDKKYSAKFDDIFKIHNTRVKKLPYRSPNLNPYCEAWAGTLSRECINKFFIFGKTHFEYLIRSFSDYYNTVRPHSGLDYCTIGVQAGSVKCESQLGGVLNHYYRE